MFKAGTVIACVAGSLLWSATALAGELTVRHAGAPAKRAVFDVGDTIEAVATVKDALAGTKLTARWVDSYQRLVAEQTKPVDEGGKATFRFPVRACVSTGNRMELLAGGKPAAEPVKFGCSPQHTRPLRDWYIFPWAAYPAGTGDTLRSLG
ncbi:hypothetical protein LCGC14_2454300, partial [marine sediment metagenome]